MLAAGTGSRSSSMAFASSSGTPVRSHAMPTSVPGRPPRGRRGEGRAGGLREPLGVGFAERLKEAALGVQACPRGARAEVAAGGGQLDRVLAAVGGVGGGAPPALPPPRV